MARVVVVALNPSLERHVAVSALRRGERVSALDERVEAGGKGLDAARALARHGHQASVVAPLGGSAGAQLAVLASLEGLEVESVPVTDGLRSTICLGEPDGTLTKVELPGAALSPTEVEALVETVATASATADWVLLFGTLPGGAGLTLLERLVRQAQAAGACVAVDSTPPELQAAMAAGADVVTLNAAELAELLDTPVATVGEAERAGRRLLRRGGQRVLLGLGAAGALVVDERGAVYGQAAPAIVRGTVGAGDALLAGFVHGGGDRGALADALAWAAAWCRLAGGQVLGPEDVGRDVVRIYARVPRRRRLTVPELAVTGGRVAFKHRPPAHSA